MGMVGCSDHYGIGFFANLIKHLAIVFIALGIWVFFKLSFGVFPVNIAKTNDVLALHGVQIGSSAASDAYSYDVKFVTRGYVPVLFT